METHTTEQHKEATAGDLLAYMKQVVESGEGANALRELLAEKPESALKFVLDQTIGRPLAKKEASLASEAYVVVNPTDDQMARIKLQVMAELALV